MGLTRITQARVAAGLNLEINAIAQPTRNAAEAAGMALNQIVKSILLQGASRQLNLFLTATGNQIVRQTVACLTAEPLHCTHADTVRRMTGVAFGADSPVGNLTSLPGWFDPARIQFPDIWASADTRAHIFQVAPNRLLTLTNAVLVPFNAPCP